MEYSAVSTIWVLVGAALVFFMQAGFAMVETGLTRAKNAGNIIMKNLMDFCIGTPCFLLIGFGLMFGGDNPFIGSVGGVASEAAYGTGMLPQGVPFYVYFIFQTVFCATSATIVSGAMAERTKFSAYCLYSMLISLFVYPISGHWIWGGGWLADLGFHDFAGSTAVHMVGGVAAFIGAWILGPRIGKYDSEGKPKAIPGHSLTLAALGVFILWFCWFGFNGTSTVSMEGEAIPMAGKIFVTTNTAAAVATCTVMIITWIRYKKPDVSMTLNGSLAGLVAITAGCDTVTPVGSAIIGIIAGFAVVFGIEFIDKVLKIDDPVGAIGVHGICGALGTLLVGLFSDGSGTYAPGLFYGGGISLLITEAIGVFSTMAWAAVTMIVIFSVIRKTIGLRVSQDEEIAGLDIREHGLTSSYADFLTFDSAADTAEHAVHDMPATAPDFSHKVEEIVTPDGRRYTKVAIVTRQNKLSELLKAFDRIGVTGVTITNVLGCGVQKGQANYYRGVELEMSLLPKVKVEVVVSKVPVTLVIETARKVLYTGKVGDGKVFVYPVENVVKIRTGEQGYAALQDSAD